MAVLSDVLSTARAVLYSGFALTLPFLLLGRLLFPGRRDFWRDLFQCANTLLIIGASFLLFDLITSLLLTAPWWEEMALFKWRVFGPYWWSYWVMIVLQLAPLAFTKRKYRRSYKISLLFWFLSLSGWGFERLVIFASSRYRNYLPSSWTYYGPSWQEYLFPFMIFSVLMTTLYFLFVRRHAVKQTL